VRARTQATILSGRKLEGVTRRKEGGPERKMKLYETTVTIHDVARLAEVSSATVSRALNKPDMVRQETVVRVLAAIKASGYSPNEYARCLSLSRKGKQ
jgi:hypothetical protein